MNRISGIIKRITVNGHLSLVHVNAQNLTLSAIVIDTPETCSYLATEHPVTVIFKETEVIIGTGNTDNISLQNQLPGQVTTIETGALLSKVKVETIAGTITSIITSRAIQQLQLTEGSLVTAMIKTNEVMLSA